MKKITEYSAVYGIGAAGYTLLEVMWRGYSHWTMALTGGACFVFIYFTEERYADAPLWKRCLSGSLFISLSELVVGFVVNMLLGWAVWDYSKLKLDLFGQVSLLYSVLWFLLCMPASYLCRRLRSGICGLTASKTKRQTV